MKKKRILLTALAMILVCVLSVAGTMALLAEGSNAVVNTFVASSDKDNFVDSFTIKEYVATANAAGEYTLSATETEANTYDVTPGVTLPKDAFVKLSRTNATPAYLFIEVNNKLSNNEFSMGVDSAWGELEGVTGKNGGQVYVLGTAVAPTILNAVENGVYHIIDGNKVSVANDAELKITAGSNDTIKFYAYICQATVAKADGTNTSVPAEVFDICF